MRSGPVAGTRSNRTPVPGRAWPRCARARRPPPAPTPGRRRPASRGATPCADALCLSDGSGLAVVDPGTGAVRWRTAERAYAEPPGLLAGRLLVEPLGARAMLVDVGTGRPVLDLSGWRAESADTGATPVFARWQRPADGPGLFP